MKVCIFCALFAIEIGTRAF